MRCGWFAGTLAGALLALACGGSGSKTPSTPTTPSTPGTPAAPPTVTVERIDAATECDGLLPTQLPDPVTVMRAPPAGTACAGGVSDGTGHVALAARVEDADAMFEVRSPSGDVTGAFRAYERLLPEAAGWHAVAIRWEDRDVPQTSGDIVHLHERVLEHLVVAADGAVAQRTTVTSGGGASLIRWSFGEDPRGGSVVQVNEVDQFHNHFRAIHASRFDAGGTLLYRTDVAIGSTLDENYVAGAVSTGGASLHLFYLPGSGMASWRDRSGATGQRDGEEPMRTLLGAITPEQLASADFVLLPLLDGGLVLGANGTYYRAWDYLAPTSKPVPTWIAFRSDRKFRFTRGNRGYASFGAPGAASADCTQGIEILAPSGRLCGRVVLHEEGTGCTTGIVDQGWDGTVVQQSGHGACRYRWWSRLLAGE